MDELLPEVVLEVVGEAHGALGFVQAFVEVEVHVAFGEFLAEEDLF